MIAGNLFTRITTKISTNGRIGTLISVIGGFVPLTQLKAKIGKTACPGSGKCPGVRGFLQCACVDTYFIIATINLNTTNTGTSLPERCGQSTNY